MTPVWATLLDNAEEEIATVAHGIRRFRSTGNLREAVGPMLRGSIPGAALGDIVTIESSPPLDAEIVAFRQDEVVLCPLGECVGLFPGVKITRSDHAAGYAVSDGFLGSVLNARGTVLQSFCQPEGFSSQPLSTISPPPPCPLDRSLIREILATGVRAIDGFVTLGKGQRIAVFAEPGVGKSSLLQMIARNAAVDVLVIALVGERGREVMEFVHTLDEDTRRRSIIVVSTSDEAPLLRRNAPLFATSIAEYFRNQGSSVLLLVDSLTRFCRAGRELGLAAGEPPVRRGYPASVFQSLPRLIERAGINQRGSITAIYTVLASADLDEDPMVEEIKGVTDGHITLSKTLADQGHYPAIDIVSSLSRLQSNLLPKDLLIAIRDLRRIAADAQQNRELVILSGDARLAEVLAAERELRGFLAQDGASASSWDDTAQLLVTLAERLTSRLS